MSSKKSSFFCLFPWYFFTYFTSSLIALLTHCLPITDEVSIKSVMIRQYALREDVLTLNRFFCDCNYIQTRWSFDSKPTLLCLQRDFAATGNFVHCLLLSQLKLGLELKQKYPPKSLFPNNSYPTFLEWKNTFFHDSGIWGKAEARFRVKTKVPPEVTNYEQFLPHISGAKKCFFSRWWNLKESWSSVDSVQGSCFSVTVEFVSLL